MLKIRFLPLLLITSAAFALRLFFINDPGQRWDIGSYARWALGAADVDWSRAYDATHAAYGPVWMFFYELIGRGYRAFVANDPNGSTLRVLIKLPSVIFDLIGGVIAYVIARRFTEPRFALLVAAFFDFNPALIYDSSIWGECDSMPAVSALAAVCCLLWRKRTCAYLLFTVAVLIKAIVIVIAPLFLLEAFVINAPEKRRSAVVGLILNLAAALLVVWLIAFPFYTEHGIYSVYRRVYDLYFATASMYPHITNQAFNMYAFNGHFDFPDTIPALFVPLKIWATCAFLTAVGFICRQYCRLRDDRGLLEACFLILLAFFLIPTEIHERYLVYALTFAPALVVFDRVYLWASLCLMLTGWINMNYALHATSFIPLTVRFCVVLNILTFAVVAWRFLHRNAMRSNTTVVDYSQ